VDDAIERILLKYARLQEGGDQPARCRPSRFELAARRGEVRLLRRRAEAPAYDDAVIFDGRAKAEQAAAEIAVVTVADAVGGVHECGRSRHHPRHWHLEPL